MPLETDLYTLLSTDASIAAAMGLPLAAPNVWRGAIPPGSPDSPALVIQMIYSNYLTAAESVNALQMKRMQFDSYHAQYDSALTISNAVRDLIKNMRIVSLANTEVQGTIINKDMDLPEEPGSNGNVFRRLLEIDFWHTDGAGSVPFSPTNPPVAGSNAAFIEGVPVAATRPTDGQILVYSAAQGNYVPATPSTSGGRVLTLTATGDPHIFTLSGAPGATTFVFRNGQYLKAPGDYSISGLNLTFVVAPVLSGPTPDTLDVITF